MKKLLNIAETADMLNVSDRTVYELIYKGKLRAAKIGGKWGIRQEWVDEYIDSCVIAAS